MSAARGHRFVCSLENVAIFEVTDRNETQRAQWAKYFSAIHAIIFLAPISAFDQHLHEDRRVNRLDDTVQLWKQVCSNKLIQNTEIVVFLNKQDLLARKLASGIRFSSWVRNYRGAEDAESVSNYLKTKFTDIFRQSQRPPSSLHMFFTSVVVSLLLRCPIVHKKTQITICRTRKQRLSLL